LFILASAAASYYFWLFQRAYVELGFPDGNFNDRLLREILAELRR
jgi:hypothetical protein